MPPARGWWQATVGGLPRTFWVIWTGTVIDRLGCFVVPFLSLYLTRERGLSAAAAGVLVSVHGLGGVGAGLIGGVLADRVGRRRTALLGLLHGASATVALSFAQQISTIALFTFGAGLLYGLYRPAVSAMVADLVPPAERQRAFNLLYWAVNLGFSVSLMAAGWLAHFGFRVLFLIDATSTVLFALFAFLIGCVFAQWSSSMPLAMQSHGLVPAQYGMLMAINGAMIVVLQPLAPRVVGRRGARDLGLVRRGRLWLQRLRRGAGGLCAGDRALDPRRNHQRPHRSEHRRGPRARAPARLLPRRILDHLGG